MRTDREMTLSSAEKMQHQEPFKRVAPLLSAALLLGAGGGFALATVLTLTQLLQVSLGSWWPALAQAHGHLQLYGWAGLLCWGWRCIFCQDYAGHR